MKQPMQKFMNARTRYVLNRFAIKLGIVALGALVQSWTPWGFGRALLALTMLSAFIDILLAAHFRERPAAHALVYWDEALAFIAVSLVILAFLGA